MKNLKFWHELLDLVESVIEEDQQTYALVLTQYVRTYIKVAVTMLTHHLCIPT